MLTRYDSGKYCPDKLVDDTLQSNLLMFFSMLTDESNVSVVEVKDFLVLL